MLTQEEYDNIILIKDEQGAEIDRHNSEIKIGTKKEEEEEYRKRFKNDVLDDYFNRESVTGENPNTLVCDGATLNCPKAKIVVDPWKSAYTTRGRERPALINQLPVKEATVTVKVYRDKGYLMGKDPIVTVMECEGKNFVPFEDVICEITGEKCRINEVGGVWENVSSNFKVCNQDTVLMKSTLKCNIDSILPHCLVDSTILTVTDNGQNVEIKNASLEILLTPTDRKITKGIIIAAVVIFAFKGVIIAAKGGGLLYIYNQGYLASGGSAMGGAIALEKETGMITKTFTAINYTGSMIEDLGGGVFIEKTKGIIGNPGLELYEKTEAAFNQMGDIDLMFNVVDDAGKWYKNQIINQKLKENDTELQKILGEKGLYKIPEKEFREYDLKKEKKVLTNKKNGNYTTVENIYDKAKDDLKDNIEENMFKKIEDERMREALRGSLVGYLNADDWVTYYSQIEYSKNPFVTEGKIEGVYIIK